ncbi:lipase 3-like [Galleria mellonella]|uniref:Lipase 3-like n=1 Tax=Galleria mellonella TaxID=7137 RepID=A0A6J1W9E7_GALME|nr:lipase 3-like [Galleria mellonella]
MDVNIFLLLVLVAKVSTENETWASNVENFFKDQTNKVNEFFEDQKRSFEATVNSSYEEAVRVHNTVNNYLEEQKKIINDEVNAYVEGVKETGREITDTWSYVPDSVQKSVNGVISDALLSIPAIIARNGYICETHTVVSRGYFLNIHRIPRTKHGSEVPSKTVFLQHGIFGSSADWIINGPHKGLGYVLADAGYDVWMANIRGNKYSREHSWWGIDSKEYWNFSWHDVALYDVPAIIDYINKVKNGDARISYIGHSMGTTILFAMLSLRPEYNNILYSAIALAPVVFTSDVNSSLTSLAPIASNVAYMEMMYGAHEFIPKDSFLGSLPKACDVAHVDKFICNHIIFKICGYDEAQMNSTILPVFLAHLGTGTSWKTAVHFAQEIVAGGKFQQFDYGSYYNEKVYGAETPPEYDLSKITLPITLFWAENDLLSREKDVRKLREKLPSTTQMYLVPYPEFNHIDYIWANDAQTLVNEKVLSTLKSTFENERKVLKFKFGF